MRDDRTKNDRKKGMTFSALLLAGGESRRMGRDKAAIEVGGRALWERQLELLHGLSPEKIFVSARTKPSWLSASVELLLDDLPSRGPLSGLTKGLTAMQTTHLIALAIDMPFMTAGELGNLLERATESCGVVATIGNRVEPLAAIYPAEAAEDFKVALAGSDFSLQSLVRKLADVGKVRLWPVQHARARLYRSMNEPDDLKEFIA
jgi:molybdenum cofactor guanylyltransferase